MRHYYRPIWGGSRAVTPLKRTVYVALHRLHNIGYYFTLTISACDKHNNNTTMNTSCAGF